MSRAAAGMITRRCLPALAPVFLSGVAQASGFPPAQDHAGTPLLRNGEGARRYLGFAVYRAALYLPQPMRDPAAILAAAKPWLILLRPERAVPRATVLEAWRQAYAANNAQPAPAALLGWAQAAEPGAAEEYAGSAAGARLAGPGRQDGWLPGAGAARELLATWLGTAPPTEALKRALLGLA